MSTLRERFAAVRDNTRTRTPQPASSSASSSNASAGAAPRHAATPAPRPAPQGEIFDALSTTLPPAPVARNGPVPSSSGTPMPPSPCPPPSATATPTGEAHETPSEQVARAPRSKGRRANSDDAPAAPATRKMPLSRGMLIVAGVVLLLALFIGTMVIKRGLLASLRQRRAAKKKAESLDPDDDDGDDDDGAKSAGGVRGGKGKAGGVLGGFFGGKDKSEPADVARSARPTGHGSASDPRQSRTTGSVPPMDPYQGRGVRAASASRSPLPSTPSHAGQPPTAGPHGPAPAPQHQQLLHQQPPAHPAYQQQQQPLAQPPAQQQQPQMAPPPVQQQQQQTHRQASPRMALGHAPHQQHPPYAPHVQARLDGVPHPNMPPPTPQTGRLSPGGGRA